MGSMAGMANSAGGDVSRGLAGGRGMMGRNGWHGRHAWDGRPKCCGRGNEEGFQVSDPDGLFASVRRIPVKPGSVPQDAGGAEDEAGGRGEEAGGSGEGIRGRRWHGQAGGYDRGRVAEEVEGFGFRDREGGWGPECAGSGWQRSDVGVARHWSRRRPAVCPRVVVRLRK